MIAFRRLALTPASRVNASLSFSTSPATDFWSSLRRNAALIITNSLPADEQKELLDKVGREVGYVPASEIKQAEAAHNSSKVEEELIEMKNSIAEAVAQARLDEAVLQQLSFDKQKEQIQKEAEKAAMKRMETEIRVQNFQKWKNDIEQANSTITTANEIVAKATSVQEPQVGAHPVLGPTVVDLGYKRIHLVPVDILASIKVWEKQRIYRHDRATVMAKDKKKSMNLGFPGIIEIYEVGFLQSVLSGVKLGYMVLNRSATGPRRETLNH